MTDVLTEAQLLLADIAEVKSNAGPAGVEPALNSRPGGVDYALDLVFGSIGSMIDPARVKKDSGTFQFDVRTADGVKQYTLDVNSQGCTSSRGVTGQPDVVIGMALDDILDIAAGELTGSDAFMAGKLKIRGNSLAGMKFGSWIAKN